MSTEARLVIGAKLKEAREYLDISQEVVAKHIGINRTALSLIESGQRKLDAVELMALAKLYQRPIAYFTDENFSIEPNPNAAVFARKIEQLSDNDRKELEKFAEFLSMKSAGE
jgi:transcriptional regulator with XRE-family HTH domain